MGERSPARGKKGLTYKDAGVSIEGGDAFARTISSHMRRTHGPRVIANEGGFAGLFRLDYNETLFKRNFKDPVLVACTDGVGTKTKLGLEAGSYEGLGQDLVAMCVNDLVVQGAEPLIFLDYIACGALDRSILERLVAGVAEACRVCDTALLGGETAEMPDAYAPGEIDLAGFSVGVVELSRATDPDRVEAGDVVIGLGSDGVHSNGFSLVRAVMREAGLSLGDVHEDLDPERTLGEVLLAPTRLYAPSIVRLLRNYRVKKVVSGMAHVTGGGLEGNLSRALHDGVDAALDAGSWEVPRVFEFLRARGGLDEQEMRRVFNMGIGFCLIVRPTFAASVEAQLRKSGERPFVIGEVVAGEGRAYLR